MPVELKNPVEVKGGSFMEVEFSYMSLCEPSMPLETIPKRKMLFRALRFTQDKLGEESIVLANRSPFASLRVTVLRQFLSARPSCDKVKFVVFLLNWAATYSDTIFEKYKNHIGLNGTTKMGIQNFSEDVLVVDLPSKEPHIGNELKNLNEVVITRSDCDVVVDFSRVEIVTSSDLSNLLTLRALLRERGRQLILCSISTLTKGIFTVAGLDAVFEFASDKHAALAALQRAKGKPTHTPS